MTEELNNSDDSSNNDSIDNDVEDYQLTFRQYYFAALCPFMIWMVALTFCLYKHDPNERSLDYLILTIVAFIVFSVPGFYFCIEQARKIRRRRAYEQIKV